MKFSKLASTVVKLVEAREPILLVGQPGVGKTDLMKLVARELKWQLIVFHPVVDDPTDYKGLAGIVQKGGRPGAEFLPFGMLEALINADKPTLVFFDDLGQATPAVQAAIMQLVLARHINGHKVSDEVVFVAATNRRQDKAAVQGLISPLLDRFITVLQLDIDVDDWVKWSLENGLPPVLAAFVRFKPQLLTAFEPSKDMKKSPTPRSIAGVGRLLNLGMENDIEVLSGAVGEGFAAELTAFLRVWMNLPSKEEIYANPDKVKVPEAKQADVRYAVCGMLAHNATKANFSATMKYIQRLPLEFQVLFIKDATSQHQALRTHKDFDAWLVANQNVLIN
jgi:DNA polymerase III delta prime subunit